MQLSKLDIERGQEGVQKVSFKLQKRMNDASIFKWYFSNSPCPRSAQYLLLIIAINYKKNSFCIFINYSHLLTQTVKTGHETKVLFWTQQHQRGYHESRMNFCRIIHSKMVEKHVPALFLELFVAFSEGGPIINIFLYTYLIY